LLAANVVEGDGPPVLTFEESGAYRLLLSAMSEDPAELQRLRRDRRPLVAYDEQYETGVHDEPSSGRQQRRRHGARRLHPSPHHSLPSGTREGPDSTSAPPTGAELSPG
jgi:hypothetical protein